MTQHSKEARKLAKLTDEMVKEAADKLASMDDSFGWLTDADQFDLMRQTITAALAVSPPSYRNPNWKTDNEELELALDAFWNAAYRQGWDRTGHDDEAGSAQKADNDLRRVIANLLEGGATASAIRKAIDRFERAKLSAEGELEPSISQASSIVDAIEPEAIPAFVTVAGWIYEDDLPPMYPYDIMFQFSKVDGVRLFPVFLPLTKEST